MWYAQRIRDGGGRGTCLPVMCMEFSGCLTESPSVVIEML